MENIEINNNIIDIDNNNNDNNINNNEKLFWKIYRNKIIKQNIYYFIQKNSLYKLSYNCLPIQSINYLIDNDLIHILKHKVLNNQFLIINSNGDKKRIYKHSKLFKSLIGIKDSRFYRSLFVNYLKNFIQYDFDKLIEAIYQYDNSFSLDCLYRSFENFIENLNLYTIQSITERFEYYLINYHSFKCSVVIIKRFLNHKTNDINYIKNQLNQQNQQNYNDNKNPKIFYKPKTIGGNGNVEDKKILKIEIIWKSIMNCLIKDQSYFLLKRKPIEDCSNLEKQTIEKYDQLDWTILFKKYFKFLNTIVNQLGVIPPTQNFKFFSPKNWVDLFSTLYHQCPFDSNWKLKWFIESCLAIYSLDLINSSYIPLNLKNILKKQEIEEIKSKFTKDQLNQRLNDIQDFNTNENLKKLFKTYLEISRLSVLYSRNFKYYLLFGNDDFQTLDLNQLKFLNHYQFQRSLILNSFYFGKFELLNYLFKNSKEKDLSNLIITVIEKELELNNYSASIVFKNNSNQSQQFEFLNQINLFYSQQNQQPQKFLNLIYLISLIILTDNLNLINFTFELFKDQILSIYSNNNNNSNSNFLNFNNNLFINCKSNECLIHLFELLNNNKNIKIQKDFYMVWFLNGRLDLLSLFEKLNDNSKKLKFLNLKEYKDLKLSSNQFENYIFSLKYIIENNLNFEINWQSIKESILFSNQCKQRYSNSKDIELFKFIIENSKESYKPLEMVNHVEYAINLPIIKFYKWILDTRQQDIQSGRCQLNKNEIKLLQYYTNNLELPLEHNKFKQDYSLVMDAITKSGDFKTWEKIVEKYELSVYPKVFDLNFVKSTVELGDKRIIKYFNWNDKFYHKKMLKVIFYNDHLDMAIDLFNKCSISELQIFKCSNNKYSTLNFNKLFKDVCFKNSSIFY